MIPRVRAGPRWSRHGLGVLCLGVTLIAGGVEPYQPRRADPILEPWRWRTFPELSGLGTECLTESADGTLWFGTPAGVWSYDGFGWVHHEPSKGAGGNAIALCASRDNAIFIGGGQRIDRLYQDVWTPVLPKPGTRFAEVRKLATAVDGSIWAATSWGAVHFDGRQSTLHTTATIARQVRTNGCHPFDTIELLPDGVATKPRPASSTLERHDLAEVAIEDNGRVWLGTVSGEALRYDPSLAGSPEAWTLANESDGLECGQQPSICPLADGTVWMVYGNGSRHLHVFDGGRWHKSLFSDLGVPAIDGRLFRTRDGVVWLSGRYQIAAHRAGKWTTYQRPTVPIPSAQNYLLQTRDGALWMAGPGTEVVRIDYQTDRWETYLDLNFQWESPSGTQWFLHRDGRVVAHTGEQWSRYGVEDGLIDTPVALIGTRRGEVWAAGSHDGTAATARFDGQGWSRSVHPQFSWGVDWRAVTETSDGSVWFGAAVDSKGPPQHRCGLLQFRDGTWIHHHQPGRAPVNAPADQPATLLPATVRPEPIGKFVCLGESPGGVIWAGRNLLARRDDTGWHIEVPIQGPRWGIIETMLTDRDRNLWMGTRQFGAFRYDGHEWQRFQGKTSLTANSVRSLAQTTDGSIWAATDRGFSRFDGTTWTADVLPPGLSVPVEAGSLKSSPAGWIWINRFPIAWTLRARAKTPTVNAVADEFWTVGHRPRNTPPETTIHAGPPKIPHSGNWSVAWSGTAPWEPSPDAALEFSYRLDGGLWSPFTSQANHTFLSLPPGPHRLEVRARDLDFNVDPLPALWNFVVQPPVWRQTWFLSVMLPLGGLAVAQTLRVFREQNRLRAANRVLAAEIQDRQRAELATRESDELYRTLLATSPDAITMTDLAGHITLASAKALELFRVPTLECAVGRSIFEWVSREDRGKAKEAVGVLMASGVLPVHTFTLRRDDGTVFEAETSVARILSADGTPRGLVVISRDVTSQRLLESQLRQAQKLEAIGQLAAGVAHDFNNILAVILMQVEMTGSPEDLPDITRSGLSEIRQAAERAADLTRQLLLFARKQTLRPRDLDLNAAVSSLVQMLHRIIGEDVGLHLRLHPRSLIVRADPGMLHQVLMNLAVNARDAMPQGGQLIIETDERNLAPTDEPIHPDAKPGRYAWLRVRDTGTGIPPEIRSRIFDPFFTTKEPGRGTGLGLATVFGIIQQHNGFVHVDSETGRGTCFHVYLPEVQLPIDRLTEPEPTPLPNPSRDHETILLVEDEAALRSITARVLASAGYRILEAADGVEALRLWAQHSESIGLLLTDLVMPGGVSGQQLASRLQKDKPQLPILFTSGYSADLDHLRIQQKPTEYFVQKPLQAQELLAAIRRCLDRSPSDAGDRA